MKVRPVGNLSATQIQEIIERSIETLKNWNELTEGRFDKDVEERETQLLELLDIIWTLVWRYGSEKNVTFQFSNQKDIEMTSPIEDIVETDSWRGRLWALEDTYTGTAVIYVNF